MDAELDPKNIPAGQYLVITILGYKRPGLSDAEYRHHMTKISAPMTKDLMVKYGVKRWTQIHNSKATRGLMAHIFDHQMANVADYDCFSQAVFRSIEDYKNIKKDPWYKEHLMGDHEKFGDTKRSKMTIGWISEHVKDGGVWDGTFVPYGRPTSSAKLTQTVVLGALVLQTTVLGFLLYSGNDSRDLFSGLVSQARSWFSL